MTVTLYPTTRIVDYGGVQCRVWEGHSDKGVEVQALIPRIAALDDQDVSDFSRALQEREPPSAVQAFPLRMVI